MGFVFKKAWTAPLPVTAEVTTQRGVQIARWRIRGGALRTAQVLSGADGRPRIRGETRAYWARYRNGEGVWAEQPTGCRDVVSAKAVLHKLEQHAERVFAGVVSADEDIASKHGGTGVEPHLDAWQDHLRLKGTSRAWYSQARKRVMRIVTECAIKRLRNVSADAVEGWLAQQADKGMSAATRNEYRGTCVTFLNWCVRTKRVLRNPLLIVAVANRKADVRRERRAFTEQELGRLLLAAQRRPLADALLVRRGSEKGTLAARVAPETRAHLERLGFERALMYKTLVLTGLRKGELASLTVGQVDLASRAPHLVLRAKDEKNRRGSEIPLRIDLAADLRAWLATRLTSARERAQHAGEPIPLTLPGSQLLFDVPDKLIRIFDRDLVFAGLARVERRGNRDVVIKTDDRGRTLDVHALRHTFGTHLSMAGVPLRTAQSAMRHSDPSLTANVYTDPRLLDVAGAIATLPHLPLPGNSEDRADRPATRAV